MITDPCVNGSYIQQKSRDFFSKNIGEVATMGRALNELGIAS